MDIEPIYDPINNNVFVDPLGSDIIYDDLNLNEMLNNYNDNFDGITLKKSGTKKTKKVKRAKVIIVDLIGNENIAPNTNATNTDCETSDEDFEDDVPCKMDKLMLPNANTDSNAMKKSQSACHICQYQAAKGWKQLTKHYVRKHSDCEIPLSRLASDKDPHHLSQNPIAPEITRHSTGLMIKSQCPICNDTFRMCSEKWLMHFVAHTGNEHRSFAIQFCSDSYFERFFVLLDFGQQVNTNSSVTSAISRCRKIYTKSALP